MPGFLYFSPTPNATTVPLSLAYAYEQGEVPATRTVLANGPCGLAGTVFGRHGGRVGYYEDSQTWRPIPKANLWIGYETEQPPGPGDLSRPMQLAGHPVRLGDGHEWIVPIARSVVDDGEAISGAIALPRSRDLDADGDWCYGEVVPQYRQLWTVAEQFADVFYAADDKTISEATALTWCVLALRANYRLSAIEAAILKLFDDATYTNVLHALIDVPKLLAWLEKKTRSDYSSGIAGDAVYLPSIDQALQTSIS